MKPTVLITGCSSGFGRLMVTDFLAAGWFVFASMRRAAERQELFRQELKDHGDSLRIVQLDVTSPAERAMAIETIGREAGGLNCLVNNAGYMLLGALEDTGEEQIRRQMEVNLFAPILLTQSALPLLRKNKGIVINVSSIFGFCTWPLASTYCASKYALEGLSESLVQELAPHGVRVVVLEPGRHETRLNDNVEWGAGGTTKSLYQTETSAYRIARQSLDKAKQGDPGDVARAAVSAAGMQSPSLRFQIGKSIGLTYRLTRWFPESFGIKYMRRAFRSYCGL